MRACIYIALTCASLLATAQPGLAATDPAAPGRPSAARPAPEIPPGKNDYFEDATLRAGIRFVHQFNHRRIANILLSNGAGGTVLDYDNDGLPDLFFVNWGPLDGVTSPTNKTPREPNRLYRNRGDGTFEDRTAASGLAGHGYCHAAAAGDFDNDGFTDIYVVAAGKNQLYRNRGDGTFQDVTHKAGVGDLGTGISAVFADIDNDGWLDLYLANYLTYIPDQQSEQNPGAYPGPLAYRGEANVLYRNRGDGTFEDITRKSGLYAPGHRAMAVSAFDCDWDGDTDLYVCNDDTPNALWINDGKGKFRDVAPEMGAAFNSIGEAPGSMNAAIADCDRDGFPDLFITRLGYGSLYVRRGHHYEDRMWASGLGLITQNYVGWGGVFIDFDNDGATDLLVANGDAFKLEGTQTLLMRNTGAGHFTDASQKGGRILQAPINGRGNASLDYDNDGRMDAVITALADRPYLLHNRTPRDGRHWLKLSLRGTRSNRSGYGARITLQAGDTTWRAEAICPAGFLMQGDSRVHFGLGTHPQADRIRIQWPSGAVQELTATPADQILTLREPNP